MADEYQKSTIPTTHDHEQSSDVISADEIKDRGLFDFISGKKKEDAEVATVTTELEQVHVSEHEQYLHENKTHEDIPHHYEVEEEKKPSLLEKLHRSGSSSSSSSEEEVELEGGEKIKRKKKKGLKEKIKEKLHKGESEEKKKEDHYYTDDTSVPIEVVHETVQVQETPLVEPVPVEEKKGFLEKIKEKLPGGAHKKPEDIPPPAPVVVLEHQEEEHKAEKKGIFEKIKEKIPGYHKHEETAVEKEIKEKEKDEKETPSHY